MPFGVQTGFSMLRADIMPATDGTRGRLHLANAPAGAQQGYRHPTTDFELEFGAFGSPADLNGLPTPFL
jgi:hypothetical protein